MNGLSSSAGEQQRPGLLDPDVVHLAVAHLEVIDLDQLDGKQALVSDHGLSIDGDGEVSPELVIPKTDFVPLVLADLEGDLDGSDVAPQNQADDDQDHHDGCVDPVSVHHSEC